MRNPVESIAMEPDPLGQALRGGPCPKRILLPRFDTHGDLLLLKGLIDALLERLPATEITLLVRAGYDQLACLFSDRLVWRTLPHDARARYSDEELPEIAETLADLAAEPWDLVLFTTYDRTFLDDLLAAALETPPRIALGRPPVHPPWERRVISRLNLPAGNHYTAIVPVDEHLHETEKYRRLWQYLMSVDQDIGLPTIEVPAPLRAAAGALLAGLDLSDRPYAVCMPAGVQNVTLKTWPLEFFAETLAWLVQARQLPPLLIGHESETRLVEALRDLAQARGVSVRTWLGRTGELGLLAALLRRASLYLGNDSAPMHLAAAVGTPTLGIFGGGTWPRFTAVGPRCLSVAAEVPCGGCSWDCPFGEAHCLRAIEPRILRSGIDQLLNETPSGARILSVAPALPPAALRLMTQATATHRALKSELEQRQDVIDELAYAYAAVSAAYRQVSDEIGSLRPEAESDSQPDSGAERRDGPAESSRADQARLNARRSGTP